MVFDVSQFTDQNTWSVLTAGPPSAILNLTYNKLMSVTDFSTLSTASCESDSLMCGTVGVNSSYLEVDPQVGAPRLACCRRRDPGYTHKSSHTRNTESMRQLRYLMVIFMLNPKVS